jgi:hypothetical protein
MNKPHNLDIKTYSFQEILSLFHLETCTNITLEDMKYAKKIVLSMHPDKSQLPPEYFLFYKRALDIVVDFYQEQTRTQQTVPQSNPVYVPQGTKNGLDTETQQEIQKKIAKTDTKEFQKKFNQLFDENMLNMEKQKKDQERNQWFTRETSEIPIDITQLQGDVHHKIEKIKQAYPSQNMIKYQGVQPLNMISGGPVGNLYDEDLDNVYVSTDPFSKLKYDDLRKVHKDETVFTVSENDLQYITQYHSTDHLKRVRGAQSLTPLDKKEAMRLLAQKQSMEQEQILKQEYLAKLSNMEYEKKNNQILSQFLLLQSIGT